MVSNVAFNLHNPCFIRKPSIYDPGYFNPQLAIAGLGISFVLVNGIIMSGLFRNYQVMMWNNAGPGRDSEGVS